jgi:hypothetical protein
MPTERAAMPTRAPGGPLGRSQACAARADRRVQEVWLGRSQRLVDVPARPLRRGSRREHGAGLGDRGSSVAAVAAVGFCAFARAYGCGGDAVAGGEEREGLSISPRGGRARRRGLARARAVPARRSRGECRRSPVAPSRRSRSCRRATRRRHSSRLRGSSCVRRPRAGRSRRAPRSGRCPCGGP